MHFTVVGVGAVGGIIGGGLAKTGTQVVLVDREAEHVHAINARGLVIEEDDGQYVVRAVAATPEQLAGPLDVVVVAVKSQDTEGVLRWLSPRLTERSVVVSLQNGLNHEVIAREIGNRRTVAAFVNFQGSYLGPGHLQAGRRGSLHIGEMDGVVTDRLRALQADFDRVRPTSLSTNIHGLLWSKLAYGSILIATGTVNAPAIEVLKRYPRLMGFLAAEVIAVGRATGVSFEPFDVFDPTAIANPDGPDFAVTYARIVESWTARPIQYTGIWRDLVVRRRKTEVPWETGLVVQRAKAVGILAPLNERLVENILQIEQGERQMAWANLEALDAILPAPRGG